jgi:hypothetical protein
MDKKALSLMAIILGASLVLASGIVSGVIYKVKALDNTLVVTGSAKTLVSADLVKWSMRFSRTVPVADLKGGYSSMEKDLGVVKTFFKQNGVDDTTLVISPIFVDKNYAYSKENASEEYLLQQTVELQSNDIEKIKGLAGNTKYIIDNGVSARILLHKTCR